MFDWATVLTASTRWKMLYIDNSTDTFFSLYFYYVHTVYKFFYAPQAVDQDNSQVKYSYDTIEFATIENQVHFTSANT